MMWTADDENKLADANNFELRRQTAALILQGIAANPRWAYTNDQMVKEAIDMTDKLFAQLQGRR
jgi:hypothetical protein